MNLSFICAICHRELETGDEFFIVNGHLLLCKDDYHDHNNQQYQGKKKMELLCGKIIPHLLYSRQ